MYTLTAGLFFGWKLGKLYGVRFALAPYAVGGGDIDVGGNFGGGDGVDVGGDVCGYIDGGG